MVGGALLFFPAYVASVVAHVYLGSQRLSSRYGYGEVAPNRYLTFFPILHNLAMIDNLEAGNSGYMWLIGFLGGAMELTGFVMLVAGQIGVADDVEIAGVNVTFLPAARDADAGGTVRLTF